MDKGRLMAIDYGSSKIGLAVTDPDRLMAFGRGVLRGLTREKALEKIWEMIINEQVVKVIIGLPMGEAGEETIQSAKIRNFGALISEKAQSEGSDVKIDYIDESFSTFEAGRVLQEIGATQAQKKETEDEIAAVILLHRYIDFRP